jgi:CheY-like chemotaxis protein
MEQTPLFRPRVLIVEDEAIVAMEIQDQLEAFGWEVCGIAATGKDAIRLAETRRPDLIIMDNTLSGPMTGVEAAETIRRSAATPLLFLTATVDDKIAARIRRIDPETSFLSKPFTEEELRREAERIAQRLRDCP